MSDQILFDGMKGKLMNNDTKYIKFVNTICKIDTSKYDYVYSLDDGWAGSLLLVKGDTYRFFKCGSGVPIINGSEKIGKFHKSS